MRLPKVDTCILPITVSPLDMPKQASHCAADVDRSSTNQQIYFLRRLPRDPFADAALPAAETWRLRSSTSPPEAPAPGRDVFDVMSWADRKALDGSHYSQW